MEKIIAQLDSLHQQLLESIADIDVKRFELRPSQAEWSIAEVVHHLSIVEQAIVKELEKSLTRPPQRLGMLQSLLRVPIWVMGTRTIRVKAPKQAEPLNPPPKATNIDNFNRVRATLKDLATRHGSDRLEQTVVKLVPGYYNGLETISFAHQHELRHYKQIQEILGKLAKRSEN